MAREKRLKEFRYGVYMASAYLVAVFLWRVFTSGGWQLPPPNKVYTDMAVDFFMLALLIIARVRISPLYETDDPRNTRAHNLVWIGLAAGIGLFLIRFSGGRAWWTGHLTNYPFSGL